MLATPAARVTTFRLILAAALCWAFVSPVEAGPLSLERFFNGPLLATGTVENRRDGSRRDFTIAMQGHWSGPHGTLIEDVAYADGERDHKEWQFERVAEGRYVGRRADVTEDAEIVEDDKGVTMTYKADTKVPAGLTLNLSFVDRLTLTTPNTVLVHSDVTYFHVSAATLTLNIIKKAAK
ncbi:DUF3833 family protein [Lichenihabitans sp. Uapishka_5]|uniref:DUF3833 family protein n=1 Tax=Lichenihabitans sp. Uapishka_5 TaxID=3037302 RepID=UPI0029E7F6F7|nr:DUF3833 family protein [Lichenihabitans sp. Uapishka_5]MDX7952975.1 DUF3833 family protein [Lichenihabitans sp. Uapishka_5]